MFSPKVPFEEDKLLIKCADISTELLTNLRRKFRLSIFCNAVEVFVEEIELYESMTFDTVRTCPEYD
jgi:hypothetical protein